MCNLCVILCNNVCLCLCNCIIYVTVHHYVSLFVAMCRYASLILSHRIIDLILYIISLCNYASLSVTMCHYVLISVTMCHHASLCVTMRNLRGRRDGHWHEPGLVVWGGTTTWWRTVELFVSYPVDATK